MSDILIPMPRDPRGHDMHDDCADWAVSNVRPFVPQGCDQQGRLKPTIEPDPVNAVMGMHDDADEQMRSADGTVLPYLLVAVICWICFIVWVLSGGANA